MSIIFSSLASDQGSGGTNTVGHSIVGVCRSQFKDRGSDYSSKERNRGLPHSNIRKMEQCGLPILHTDITARTVVRSTHFGRLFRVTTAF